VQLVLHPALVGDRWSGFSCWASHLSFVQELAVVEAVSKRGGGALTRETVGCLADGSLPVGGHLASSLARLFRNVSVRGERSGKEWTGVGGVYESYTNLVRSVNYDDDGIDSQ
jgi:hypothetical protein